MKIAVPKDQSAGETRVAASPAVVKKLIGLGASVVVEQGAGAHAGFSDSAFKEAGASIAKDAAAAVKNAAVVLGVNAPAAALMSKLKKDAIVIAGLRALTSPDDVRRFEKAGITAFAMELAPRITRAQSMDILSSQANLAGYKAVLEAASEYGRSFPMMMTAAGTVPPAKAFVMGVGVAGLQAIATAKRLGAVVTATDVRPATREQVASLGGKFLEVDPEMEREAETEGGYAREMPPEYYEKQKRKVAEHLTKQDVVITTALIPGRPAPRLITRKMVESMKAGAVIVDLAAEAGGNCELTKAGGIVTTENGVKIIGALNLPGRLAETASDLYAKNILNFLTPLVDGETKSLKIDWDDEIVKGCAVTKSGEIVNERVKEALAGAAAAKTPAAKKPSARKLAAKTPAAKKPSARKLAAKKPVAKSTAAKTPAAGPPVIDTPAPSAPAGDAGAEEKKEG